jgi:hypothetical protein
MGHRNPDRVPLSYRRSRCETVADMLRERWDVISRCRACGLTMGVNLKHIARLSGSNVSLWNRTERCRRLGCTGLVDFLAKAPGMRSHDLLAAEWPDETPPERGA